jgi:hypothetical protein
MTLAETYSLRILGWVGFLYIITTSISKEEYIFVTLLNKLRNEGSNGRSKISKQERVKSKIRRE